MENFELERLVNLVNTLALNTRFFWVFASGDVADVGRKRARIQ